MIERHTMFIVRCDANCGEALPTDVPFPALVAQLRSDGWRITPKRGGQADALCPDCAALIPESTQLEPELEPEPPPPIPKQPPPIGSVRDVALVLGVTSQRVAQLYAAHPQFPKPIAHTSAGQMWSLNDILAFRDIPRRVGRPRNKGGVKVYSKSTRKVK